METTAVIPSLLAFLLLSLLAGLMWSVVHMRRSAARGPLMAATDHVLLGGLLLGAFAMGVFLAYVLLHRL